MNEVLPELIINWDQTGLNYVSVPSQTMAEEGCKCVEIDGKDDKHRITDVFAFCMQLNKERPPGA